MEIKLFYFFFILKTLKETKTLTTKKQNNKNDTGLHIVTFKTIIQITRYKHVKQLKQCKSSNILSMN